MFLIRIYSKYLPSQETRGSGKAGMKQSFLSKREAVGKLGMDAVLRCGKISGYQVVNGESPSPQNQGDVKYKRLRIFRNRMGRDGMYL